MQIAMSPYHDTFCQGSDSMLSAVAMLIIHVQRHRYASSTSLIPSIHKDLVVATPLKPSDAQES